MPATHSKYNNEKDVRIIGKMALLPLKVSPTVKSAAAPACSPDKTDIIDEAIEYFRANILFRNYEVEGPADRLLIYLTLYITQCLNVIRNKSSSEASKLLYSLALENFSLPGEANFPLGGMVTAPAGRADADALRVYLTQARQELGVRLVATVYKGSNGQQPSKWWMQFSKLKFMDMELK